MLCEPNFFVSFLTAIAQFLLVYIMHRNILGRFLEAHGRGIWNNASEEVLDVIRQQLDIADASVEGVTIS